MLAFLARRPIHTVFMAGLIRENGLVSLDNRGTFYGCRNDEDQLIAVGLLGSKTLIETADAAAFLSLARLARRYPANHLVRGERDSIAELLTHYAEVGRTPTLNFAETLMDQKSVDSALEGEPNLRRATEADLEAIVSQNARSFFEETGTNPLETDPEGMWQRTARRVGRGRIWVLVKEGELIFKADLVVETPQASYIEGVHVREADRQQGHGRRCMTQLARNLLGSGATLCLVVNESNTAARRLYERVGYQFRAEYATAHFGPPTSGAQVSD